MERTLKIEYEVLEFGWAEVVFAGEGWRLESAASYIGDPLGDLALGSLGL